MAPGSSRLLKLPPEISSTIPSHLSNRDIKSLRLTCKALCALSPLRLDRVFLSANPRNIEVFRAIADHSVLREGVVEIIWDDARLKEGLIQRRSNDYGSRFYDPTFHEGDDVIDELDDRGHYDDSWADDDEYENEDSDEDSDDEEQCQYHFSPVTVPRFHFRIRTRRLTSSRSALVLPGMSTESPGYEEPQGA